MNALLNICLVFFLICNLSQLEPAAGGIKAGKPGKLLIIGGGTKPPGLIKKMIDESGIKKNKGYVLILPMASAEQDSAIYYMKKQLNEYGVNRVAGFMFHKGDPIRSSQLDSIKNAALIYFTGGDQQRFMIIVHNTPVERAIIVAHKNGHLIAGTSAGASVMTGMMITGNEKKHPKYESTYSTIEPDNIETIPGLGLVTGVIIDQHFIIRSRENRMFTAILQYPEIVGIGIDHSTAILVDGSHAEVVGNNQVMVFRNPGGSVRRKGDRFGGSALRVDIYLPGDTFIMP